MKDLKKSEFKRLLAGGYGNALRFLNCCGEPMKYANVIVECCTSNTCFSMQDEGSRGAYLCDAVMLTGRPEYFSRILMKRLSKAFYRAWHTVQMIDVLGCIVKAMPDNSECSEMILRFFYELYIREFAKRTGKRFTRNFSSDLFDRLCIALCRLDKSYRVRIVNDVGGYMLAHPRAERFSLDSFLYNATDFGEKWGWLKSADKCCAEAFIRKFTDSFLFDGICERFSELLSAKADEEEHDCRAEKLPRISPTRNLFSAPDDEKLLQTAKEAFNERDEEKQWHLLYEFIYAQKPFPLGFEAVREIYGKGGEDIKEICIDLMGCFKDGSAEDFLRQLISDNTAPINLRCEGVYAYIQSAEWLDSCYLMSFKPNLPTDSYALCNIWYYYHNFYDKFENRQDKNSRKYEKLRRYIYNNMNCSICRNSLVRLMVRSRDDCGDILQECCYDCNLALRKYAEGVLKKRKIDRKDVI
ncbi:MAG: hypothetical protein K2K57_13255 [Oscillospiraceae bacterium]|nr:hypothetical protein [Oscillospiraceae bacterium]